MKRAISAILGKLGKIGKAPVKIGKIEMSQSCVVLRGNGVEMSGNGSVLSEFTCFSAGRGRVKM